MFLFFFALDSANHWIRCTSRPIAKNVILFTCIKLLYVNILKINLLVSADASAMFYIVLQISSLLHLKLIVGLKTRIDWPHKKRFHVTKKMSF